MTLRRSAALLALLALAAPAAAQDTAAEAPAETTEETPAADAATAEGLSLGTEEQVVGATYIAEEFTDWALRCIRAPEGQQDECQLYQLLRDSDGNAVAEISLFGLPSSERAAAGATIITPLETLLTDQLRISVDGSRAKVYPFTFCSAIGCFARIGFTEEEVAQFRRGNAAQLTITPAAAPDQTVDLTMSLSGFTAGFAAVSAE